MNMLHQKRYDQAASALNRGTQLQATLQLQAPSVQFSVGLAALAALLACLIEAGVITEDDYNEALCREMERAVERSSRHLSALLGRDVTLL